MSTPSTPAPTPATPAAASSAPARSSKPESAPKIASATTTKPVETVPAPAPATKKDLVARKAAAAKPAEAPAPVAAKEVKAKKPKLVRDSFTIPKDEYAVIEALKQRASALAQPVKKSELLRAGLKLLATLSDSALRTALQAVPSIKTGRPKAEAAQASGASSAKPAAKSGRK